jgi:hypothetical protein
MALLCNCNGLRSAKCQRELACNGSGAVPLDLAPASFGKERLLTVPLLNRTGTFAAVASGASWNDVLEFV